MRVVAHTLLPFVALVAISFAAPAARALLLRLPGPVVHEPIPPDAREDLAFSAVLQGDLPAAIQTPSGVVAAPDPRRGPSPSEAAYGPGSDRDTFAPDRHTERPEVSGYDDPFTPSTAPFKRLEAFDGVRGDYELYVRDERLSPVPASAEPGAGDEVFYEDVVVDVAPARRVRVPSVGPGARIVRSHLNAGGQDVRFRMMHDGADNWFLLADASASTVRARLVMQVAIARTAFGGTFGDPAWDELPAVAPIQGDVARAAAAEVRAAVGVRRDTMRPREALAKLVFYFRAFADSDDPPRGRGDVYLDLALSKKGVCRHRSFSFLVTAQSLGLPARMVLNEAHAWVEVFDGASWRRIDLGGAGHMTNPASSALPERALYRPPPDAFAWPQQSERGDDMVADARARAQRGAESATATETATGKRDDRPASVVTFAVAEADAHRGLPLRVRGAITGADGQACAHAAVELWLRDPSTQRMLALGTLATGDDGAFSGGIVVPGSTPLGDYDVVACTPGDARCGAGSSP